MKMTFPDDFLWGAATSSHQIEGNNVNDWTAWEQAGHVKDAQESGDAADSWNRYGEDFALLDKLNLNAYRFSIEWSRIEPKEGEFDEAAISKYKDMLLSLKKRGVTPVVTLHHFTNPQWLEPWSKRSVVKKFAKYTERVVAEFADLVEYWCTINEPNLFAGIGYMQGIWPPGQKNPISAHQALRNTHRAHNRSYDVIHEIYASKQLITPMVSMAFNLQHYEAVTKNPLDAIIVRLGKWGNNYYTINRVKDKLDFIGINFYFSHWIGLLAKDKVRQIKDDLPKSDLGWEMYPKGLEEVIVDVKKYNLPVLITENGLADSKDRLREQYIKEHLAAVWRANQRGAQVIGYLHWSLIDNFEWAEGYGPRFGLVEVDYTDFKRTIRPSAESYAKIAKTGELTGEGN